MKLQVADRMKDYEEGIFQILNEKKEEVEKKGKKVYNPELFTEQYLNQ